MSGLNEKLRKIIYERVKMNRTEQFNIYEYLDQSGDAVKYICDGHVDSVAFREKCFKEFYVKPMIVRHQWRKTKRFSNSNPGKKYGRSIIGTVHSGIEEMGSTPVTIGLA